MATRGGPTGFSDPSLGDGALNGDAEVTGGDVISVLIGHLLTNHSPSLSRGRNALIEQTLHQSLGIKALH